MGGRRINKRVTVGIYRLPAPLDLARVGYIPPSPVHVVSKLLGISNRLHLEATCAATIHRPRRGVPRGHLSH